MPEIIHVAIVEDIREIREGLQMLINSSDGFHCDYTFTCAEDAVAQLPDLVVDVVLMDIHMAEMSGIEAVGILKKKIPQVQFIMSTVYGDDENVFQALKAGASGYLLKKTAPVKLLESITEVYAGGSPMSSQIARKVISSFRQKQEDAGTEGLTPKEIDILKSLSKGLRYKEVAADMNISIDTVRSHVRNIYSKLQVQSRTEAINKAFGHR